MEYLQAYSDAAGDQFWTMGSPSVSKWDGIFGDNIVIIRLLFLLSTAMVSLKAIRMGLFIIRNEKDLVKNMLETSVSSIHIIYQ